MPVCETAMPFLCIGNKFDLEVDQRYCHKDHAYSEVIAQVKVFDRDLQMDRQISYNVLPLL